MRPVWEGLRFDPCLPEGWNEAAMTRRWRGANLTVAIRRDPGRKPGDVSVRVDGRELSAPILPAVEEDRSYAVEVACG